MTHQADWKKHLKSSRIMQRWPSIWWKNQCSKCLSPFIPMINDIKISEREGSCFRIMTENMVMQHASAKFIPWLLMVEQNEKQLKIAHTFCNQLKCIEPFMKLIITADKMWVHWHNDKMKQQFSQWTAKLSPWPKKAWQSRSNMKIMLSMFFDSWSLVQYEFIPRGQTVNQAFNLTISCCQQEAAQNKRLELWQEHS